MSQPALALAIVIPSDSRDLLAGYSLEMKDGGNSSLWAVLEGEPEELAVPGRDDLVAFVNEAAARSDAPRNNRATKLLAGSLPPGGWVAGLCVLAGQQPDGGLTSLPAAVTPEWVDEVTRA